MTLSGNVLDYFVVFWGGVLVSFSPCVYPIMPVTASFIAGINTSGTRLRGFVISLVYVLGMAVIYGTLGAAAALTGKFFGQVQSHPATLFIIANILILLALVLFEVVPMPSLGVHLHHKMELNNLWTVFLFGMASGFMVSPCTTPILGVVLLHVASRQSPLYAFSLLFVFSYGVGASLILIGTFSGVLSCMPKSGRWLLWIKRFCGFILLIVGEYYLIQAGRLML